ncbi:sulfatase-like hydrolase/transferase [Paenibacillus sp. HB172176]|uniref:sulfatase-like hydrolase/transferase n=1 Tax=Paenibacillus sp. HB172176 TaxID=2493690 RepID=UPI00143920D2|nr:sulfatase-like hydrolase/transferase [Paenibacillus sp. HB172176]
MGEQPNILLIMTDQQRFDSLGCYGGEFVNTPELDRLAREGIVFDNGYVNATICTPSRACLMTGKALPGHGVYKLHDNLPEDQVLFPKRLKEKGYKTALFGKLHVSGRVTEADRRHPNDGFDIYEACNDPTLHLDSPLNAYARWVEEHHPQFWERLKRENKRLKHFPKKAHNTYWAAERTIDFLQTHDGEQPFFAMMSVFDPHDPYDDYPPEAMETIHAERLDSAESAGPQLDGEPEGLLRERQKFLKRYGSAKLEEDLRGYYASIGFLDEQAGRVLRKLEERGLMDNTLVIFTSDHGDMMGDKQLYTKGAYFYEACAKIPLLMRLPGELPEGERSSQLVQLHDLAGTILSAAGFTRKELAGVMPDTQNLLEIVRGNSVGRGYAVTQYRNSGYSHEGKYWSPSLNATMLRDSRYKLNMYHDQPGGEMKQEGELYDMLRDPREERNLWNDPQFADVKLRLTLRYVDWTVRQENLYLSGRGGEAVTSQA